MNGRSGDFAKPYALREGLSFEVVPGPRLGGAAVGFPAELKSFEVIFFVDPDLKCAFSGQPVDQHAYLLSRICFL